VKLIVGLGNPGAEYERTRHNAGWMVVDRLIDRHAPGAIAKSRFHSAVVDCTLGARSGDESTRTLLLKPLTYMNRSGQAVAEAIRFYKLLPAEDLLIIVDDVALPAGSIRLRADGGNGGHNGLADIQQKLGGDTYARLRVGIGEPGAAVRKDYVLGRFSPDQIESIQPALVQAADAAELWVRQGITVTMNRFNTKPDKPARSSSSEPTSSASDSNTNTPVARLGGRPDETE
jgi:peptidyl-tRNA hydrolase, PTH1 family